MLIEIWHSSVQERSYFLTPWKWSFLSVTRVSPSRPYIVTSSVFPGVAWSLLSVVPSLSVSVCSVARYGDGLPYKICARTAGSPRLWVAVRCQCCQLACFDSALRWKVWDFPKNSLHHSNFWKTESNREKKKYFCKNALFTREIISAYFFLVIPGETVLLASNSQGFVGEQRVQSLTLLSRNMENAGKNSQRKVAVTSHLDFICGIR